MNVAFYFSLLFDPVSELSSGLEIAIATADVILDGFGSCLASMIVSELMLLGLNF